MLKPRAVPSISSSRICELRTGVSCIVTAKARQRSRHTRMTMRSWFGACYEATFDVRYLQTALDLNSNLIKHFWDATNGGFYFTADDDEALLVRQREVSDNAIPSGNSVAMLNLLRLNRITANTDLEAKAAEISRTFAGEVKQAPSGHAELMSALDFRDRSFL